MRSLATSRIAGSPSGPSTANISRTLPEPRWVRPENEEAASGTRLTLSGVRRLPRKSPLCVAGDAPAADGDARCEEAHGGVTDQLRFAADAEHVAGGERVDVGLGEPHVACGAAHDPVLHHEQPVPGQAGDDERPWVEHPGVPEVVDEQGPAQPAE